MEDELDEPGAVAQVDEDQAAVVAAAVHPAGDPRLGVDPVGAAPGRTRRRGTRSAAGPGRLAQPSGAQLLERVAGVDRPLLAALHVAQLGRSVVLEDQRR